MKCDKIMVRLERNSWPAADFGDVQSLVSVLGMKFYDIFYTMF